MNPIERYYNISRSQLSIARHYGGIKVNGSEYHYNPEDDSLVRDDLHKKMIKQHKEQQRLGKELERAKQNFMF